MREIKFRVWDKENKKMWQQEDLNVQIMPDYFYHIEDLEGDLVVYPEFAEVMQCTGVKDKNRKESKEIYEGDILRFLYLIGDDHIVRCNGYVAYVGGEYRIYKKIKDSEVSTIKTTLKEAHSPKVIGNIYENEELLYVPEEFYKGNIYNNPKLLED